MSTSAISSNVYSLLTSLYSNATSSTSSTSSLNALAQQWDSRSYIYKDTSSTDSVSVSDKAASLSKLSTIDSSLSDVGKNLSSAKALAELANSSTVSDSFRAELQQQLQSYLSAVDTANANKLDNALSYDNGSGGTTTKLSGLIDISTKAGAAAAVDIFETAMSDVANGRSAVADKIANLSSTSSSSSSTGSSTRSSTSLTSDQLSGVNSMVSYFQQLQSISSLASDSTISSSFRSQLESEASDLVTSINSVVKNSFSGTMPISLGTSSSLAGAINLDSASTSQTTASYVESAIERLTDLKDQASSSSSSSSSSTSSSSTDLAKALLEAKSQWESSLFSTLLGSVGQSSSSSLNTMYSLLAQ